MKAFALSDSIFNQHTAKEYYKACLNDLLFSSKSAAASKTYSEDSTNDISINRILITLLET